MRRSQRPSAQDPVPVVGIVSNRLVRTIHRSTPQQPPERFQNPLRRKKSIGSGENKRQAFRDRLFSNLSIKDLTLLLSSHGRYHRFAARRRLLYHHVGSG